MPFCRSICIRKTFVLVGKTERQKRSETKMLKLIVVQGDDYLRDYLIVTLFFFCKLIFFFQCHFCVAWIDLDFECAVGLVMQSPF